VADQGVVWTVGYQGRTLSNLLDVLDSVSVEVLVDIRSKPFSRKPGFSKGPLTRGLAHRGIRYVHLPELGMPLDLLTRRPSLKDNEPILRSYREGMADRTIGMNCLFNWVQTASVCLLCYEADVNQCHRGVVADYLRDERQLEVRHL